MAIEASQIETEITLELDEEEISVADFSKAFENFAGLVKELSKQFAPKKDSSAWLVKVYPGSAGIGFSGRPGVYTSAELNSIRFNLLAGLRELESGVRPSFFTDRSIECSKALGSLFKSKKAPPNIRIWSRQEQAMPIGRTLAARAEHLLEVAYEDDGSVDGFLQKLSAHGQFEFVVYDALDDRAIKCEVEESKLENAWASFRKRVEVLGKVRYRRDGMPVSVRATDIIPFPSPSDIPSLAEMRRLLSGT
jgi:hypothetical protein